MSARTKLILGLVGAAAVGVCVGILLAPEKGVDTRQRIKSTASDWTDYLSDLLDSAKEGIAHLKKTGTNSASDLKSKGSKLASHAAERFSDVKESYM